MNLTNQYLYETTNMHNYYNTLSKLPTWAIQEQLYNCEVPPIVPRKEKPFTNISLLRAILFWRAIVIFS